MARAKYQDWITEEGLILIQGWARDGLTDKEIALEKIGVSYSTFKDWKNKYPALSAALKEGKEVPDRKVENALYRSAMGFHYEEDMVTNLGEVVSVRKYCSPNTTAQIFWLKNRKPKQWRRKTENEEEKEKLDLEKLKKEIEKLESELSKDSAKELTLAEGLSRLKGLFNDEQAKD